MEIFIIRRLITQQFIWNINPPIKIFIKRTALSLLTFTANALRTKPPFSLKKNIFKIFVNHNQSSSETKLWPVSICIKYTMFVRICDLMIEWSQCFTLGEFKFFQTSKENNAKRLGYSEKIQNVIFSCKILIFIRLMQILYVTRSSGPWTKQSNKSNWQI